MNDDSLEHINRIKDSIQSFYGSVNFKKSSSKTTPTIDKIRLHESTINANSASALIESVLRSQITMGQNNKIYENRFAAYLGSPHVLSCNSGSSANLLIIFSLIESGMLQKGDRVIVPALSWSTTIFPLLQAGLIPVILDQSNQDFNIDLNMVDDQARRHDIKAIMLIHTYGCPVNMDSLINICEKHNLLLIEDTCESMGARWGEQYAGTFGLASSFSTYYSHHICTLEGGLVSTNDVKLNSVMQSVRSHGWVRHLSSNDKIFQDNPDIDAGFLFNHVGFNIRLSEPQAAMGIEQLKLLDSFILQRRKIGSLYQQRLTAELPSVRLQKVHSHAYHSYFGFPILFTSGLDVAQYKFIRGYLLDHGIESRPFLAGNFINQPVMRSLNFEKPYSCNVADNLGRSAIAIPCHQSISTQQANHIVDTLVNCEKDLL